MPQAVSFSGSITMPIGITCGDPSRRSVVTEQR